MSCNKRVTIKRGGKTIELNGCIVSTSTRPPAPSYPAPVPPTATPPAPPVPTPLASPAPPAATAAPVTPAPLASPALTPAAASTATPVTTALTPASTAVPSTPPASTLSASPAVSTSSNAPRYIGGDPFDNAKKLRGIYYPGCAFPDWVIKDEEFKNFKFNDTTVFYNELDDSKEYTNADYLHDVILMTIQREPANVTMDRRYEQTELKQNFGWEIGAYSNLKDKRLMPNIAIYCNARVKNPKTTNEYKNIHVINLVGFALDIETQPDYMFINKIDKTKRIEYLQSFYEKMWKLAFAACKQKGLKNLYVFNVGGGAFSEKLSNILTLNDTVENYVNTHFHKPAFEKWKEIYNDITILNRDFNSEIRIPDILFNDVLKKNLINIDETLFVNAWDPWSIIGNGNGYDPSLDGWWGRSSNISVLGWYLTNPYMSFIQVNNVQNKNYIDLINSDNCKNIADGILTEFNKAKPTKGGKLSRKSKRLRYRKTKKRM